MDIPGVSSTQSATDGPTSVGWRWGRWASQRRGGFDPAAISIPVPRSTPVWIRCRPLTRSPRWTEKEIREESEICQNEDVDAPQKKKRRGWARTVSNGPKWTLLLPIPESR